jgi:hypothetical protein
VTKNTQQLVFLALTPIFDTKPWIVMLDEGNGAGLVTNIVLAESDNRARLIMMFESILATLHEGAPTLTDIPMRDPDLNPDEN